MGRIVDIVRGVKEAKKSVKDFVGNLSREANKDVKAAQPNRGPQLGLSTPANMTGNTAIGPSGGYAKSFGTTTSGGSLTDVHAVGSRAPYTPGSSSSGGKKSIFGNYSTNKSSGGKTSGATTSTTSKSTETNRNVSSDKTGRGPSYAKGGIIKSEGRAMGKKTKGKRMAMGGLGMDDSEMRNSQMVKRGMERRMGRGREMEGGMGSYGRGAAGMNVPTTGKPAIGGNLPPVQNMGPGNMPPGKMPGAPRAALTQSAVQPPVDPNMLRAMTPGKMAPGNIGPMRMRGGGIARKGKGLTMAKGGLVKGSGCVSKGVKKPRYT